MMSVSDYRQRKKVLFLCTHNSARSQMAEGILRDLYGDRFEVFSAGAKPSTVDPRAIRVMTEIGIDISRHRSKSMSEFYGKEIDYVVTLCSDAREVCPFFPGAIEYIHRAFVDPTDISGLEESMAAFRQVRDELRTWITGVFGRKMEDGVKRRMPFETNKEMI